MRLDVTQQLRELDGAPAWDGEGRPVTLRTLLKQALGGTVRGDDAKTVTELLECYQLALAVAAEDEIELTSEQVTLIKTRIAIAYPSPFVVGRVCEALGEPAARARQPKAKPASAA